MNFHDIQHLVDVGGGNGTNLMALAKVYPHLQGSVFDLETVCKKAEAHFLKAGLNQRLQTIPGNCFQDEFPSSADAFMFCHFFTIWSKAENKLLLEKAYRALPVGGKVIIFNMMQSDHGDGPLTAAIGSPYFLTIATGKGMLYRWSEYEELFREAGFVEIQRKALPQDHGVIIGTKRYT